MSLGSIIAPDAVLLGLKATSKDDLLRQLAKAASGRSGIAEDEIFKKLDEREKLSSTGAGRGIAIPHGRMDKVQAVSGIFARLDEPVAFDAADGKPVDLVFLLLAPSNSGAEHLKALSRISRMMRDELICQQLRSAKDASEAYKVISQ